MWADRTYNTIPYQQAEYQRRYLRLQDTYPRNHSANTYPYALPVHAGNTNILTQELASEENRDSSDVHVRTATHPKARSISRQICHSYIYDPSIHTPPPRSRRTPSNPDGAGRLKYCTLSTSLVHVHPCSCTIPRPSPVSDANPGAHQNPQ